ncbi:hypothetical protein R5R35_013173 [Gryllus longicercus]|uniref:Uncharacterized protein n=2 Tax=Gryllus longicercus TaxID=2509291 RepID=A0AAN9VM90_9ORTH
MLKHAMLSAPTTTTTSSGTPSMMNGVHLPRGPPPPDGIVMLTDLPPGAHGAAAAAAAAARLGAARAASGQLLAPHPAALAAAQRLNHSHALNVSTLSTSKHSLGGNSSSVSPGGGGGGGGGGNAPGGVATPPPPPAAPKMANGGLHIPRARAASIPANVSRFVSRSREAGVKEMLTSLGLLCLVSLLLALLSLIFLLKISPLTVADIRDLLRSEQLTVISAEEYVVVYEVTLALCALTLSLNLCCLLVCAIQFLFAVKLVKSPQGGERTNKYLQKSSITRVCAVGGFFVSIPVFLTGIILYTFIQFHSTPAIVTSVFIGLGIIFCGCAMVHNVFVWQREKTNAVRALAQQQQQVMRQPTPPTPTELNKSACHPCEASGSVSPGMPPATLDLSSVTTATAPHELSTLV